MVKSTDRWQPVWSSRYGPCKQSSDAREGVQPYAVVAHEAGVPLCGYGVSVDGDNGGTPGDTVGLYRLHPLDHSLKAPGFKP
jgi:hypothetical protein